VISMSRVSFPKSFVGLTEGHPFLFNKRTKSCDCSVIRIQTELSQAYDRGYSLVSLVIQHQDLNRQSIKLDF